MFARRTKKYGFFGLGFALLLFIQLILFGCDTTSDPKVYYQATGSWEGMIDGVPVRGIIAPDGSYHLAIVNGSGAVVGEYINAMGGNISVKSDNIGDMTLVRVQDDTTSASREETFILSPNSLSNQRANGISLTRTPEATGPAQQSDVAGHWSLTIEDNFTDVVVKGDGTLSGGDGVDCQYSGTLSLLSPAWNIFQLDLQFEPYLNASCPKTATPFRGLALVREDAGEERRRLWFVSNNVPFSGANTFSGDWAETKNVAPVPVMTILGENLLDHTVQVRPGSAVKLDAVESTDENSDLLTYEWKVIYPDGFSVVKTGRVTEFIPDTGVVGNGLYTIELTASDGLTSTAKTQELTVVWTPKRFYDRGNGTVFDTKTRLVWLKDAGCPALNLFILDGGGEQWGVSNLFATTRVAALYDDRSGSDSVCRLQDGSAAGDWKVPTPNQFREIMPPTPYPTPPALLNDEGDGQWFSGRDSFINVDKYYWAKEPTAWFYVDFSYTNPDEWYSNNVSGVNEINTLWPVRALREGEPDLSGF